MKPIWLGLTLPIVGLLIVACGGGDEGDSSEGQTLEGLIAARQQSAAEQELDYQHAVQQCMAAEGFEYVPVSDSTVRTVGEFDQSAFAKEFGYGISTLLNREGELAARGGVDIQRGAGGPDDPNSAYVASLPEDQQQAYRQALLGADFAEGGVFVSGSDDGDGAEFTGLGGCLGQAQEEVGGGGLLGDDELFSAAREIQQRVADDPRMIAAWQEWSGCMSADGYDYADESTVRRDLGERFTAITGQPSLAGGDGGVVIITEERTDGEGERAPPAYDEAALEALQREELAIAGAGAACRAEHVDDVQESVRPAIEADVLGERPGLFGSSQGDAE